MVSPQGNERIRYIRLFWRVNDLWISGDIK